MSTSQVKYKPPNTFLLPEQIIFLRLKLKKKRSRYLIIIYAKSIFNVTLEHYSESLPTMLNLVKTPLNNHSTIQV